MEREMPDNSVVVNLNQFERSRRAQVSPETLNVLHGSRDLLIEGATRALTRQTEAMENALLAMAERAPLLETRNSYYSAQGILNTQANELLSACKDAYCKTFSNFVQGPRQDSHARTVRVVPDGTTRISKSRWRSTRPPRACISIAPKNWLRWMPALPICWAAPSCPKKTTRSRPRSLCESLLDGMSSMQLNQNIRVVLLNQFDLVLTTELRANLSIHQPLPDRWRHPARPQGRNKKPLAQSASASGSAVSCNVCQQRHVQTVRATCGRHRAGQAERRRAGIAGFSLLDSLGQLQSGAMMLPGGGRFELPLLEASAIQNVLRSLQQSPVMKAASPLDAVLVDAVAMLFDVVFDEASIPDRLKAQIARLQIPVLKAAMLDRNFFSQSNHPVRRMLDAIATLAVHLPENEAGNARLEAISQVVSRVLESFEKDISVFDTAAAELESMGTLLDDTLEETMRCQPAAGHCPDQAMPSAPNSRR